MKNIFINRHSAATRERLSSLPSSHPPPLYSRPSFVSPSSLSRSTRRAGFATDWNVYSKGRARVTRGAVAIYHERASGRDEIYFFGEQMNSKTNSRWSSQALALPPTSPLPLSRSLDSTSFFNFTRDVIVKYDYSRPLAASRGLFLTPGFSLLRPPACYMYLGVARPTERIERRTSDLSDQCSDAEIPH